MSAVDLTAEFTSAGTTGLAGELRAPTTTRFVTVGSARIAYRILGRSDGVPVVLLNRFRATLDEWDPEFLERLAVHRRLVLFDSEGVAGSAGTPGQSVEALAASAAAFIRALGLERVDVLGFSMGGFVAQVLAIIEPELIGRVVLVGSGAPAGEGTAPPEEVFFQTAGKPQWDFEDRVTLFYGDSPEARWRGALAEDRIEAIKRTGMDPSVSAEAVGAQVQAIQGYMSADNAWFARLGELKQPVLILSGDRDRCFPVAHVLVLLRRLPRARAEVFSMCGHAPHQQEPARAAQVAAEFLT